MGIRYRNSFDRVTKRSRIWEMPTDQNSSERQPADGSSTGAESNGLREVATSVSGVLANLNLVVAISLLAAVVSFWFDFRGAYSATKEVLSPVAAASLPSILVGLTAFVIAWCVVYGWRYFQSIGSTLDPGFNAKADLKKLVPVIESCLFFLEVAEHSKDDRKHRLMGYISETGWTIWEELLTIRLDGSTAYCIRSALPGDHPDEVPNVQELQRLLKALLPLARRGKTKEARRIF